MVCPFVNDYPSKKVRSYEITMPGSHGSLTKAGKVKNLTPKVERTGVNSRKKKVPRIRYRKLYTKRIILNRYGGQATSIAAQKYSRASSGPRPD